jgi:tetratricopeptide (TPR) repeat protein
VAARYPRRLFVSLVSVHTAAGMPDAVADELGLGAGADRQARTYAALAQAPTLLLLDNLETPVDSDHRRTPEVLARLAAIPGLLLLASLRGSALPAGVHWRATDEVRPLQSSAARALFVAESPAAEDDPGLSGLLSAMGGVPLALILLAQRHLEGDGDAATLLAQWRVLRTAVETDLAAAIELSVASPRLNGTAGRRLFALLGRLPDGMAVADREALLGADEFLAASALRKTGLAFADEADGSRLRMLPPIQAHAEGKPLDPADEVALPAHYRALAAALPQVGEQAPDPAAERRARLELRNLEDLVGRLLRDQHRNWSPDRAAELRALAVTAGIVADNRLKLGGVRLAAAGYNRAHEALTKLAAADPGNAQWQRDLSVSWNKLGDVRSAQGDLPGALQAYTEDKNIADKLATTDPGNAEWQRDLSVSWNRLGDVRSAQGDLPGALQAFTEGKNIRDRLATADPGNAQLQRDLSVSWNRLGDVRSAQGDLPGALQAYTESKNSADRLAAADPGNAEWQRDLSVSWNRLGDVRSAQGDLPGALQAFTEAKDIADRLAAADPGNAEWQRDLIVSHWTLADLLERTPDRSTEAPSHWAQALAIARTLADTGRLAPTDAWIVESLEQRLAATGQDPSAEP